MSDINMAAVVLGFVLVIALFTKLHQTMKVPAYLSPLQLDRLVGVLRKMIPTIQNGQAPAIALGYLVVVLLFINASVLMLLSLVIHCLKVFPSDRYTEQIA